MAAGLAYALAATALLGPVVIHGGNRILQEERGGGAGCPSGVCSDGAATLRDYWAAGEQGGSIFTLRHDYLLTAPEGIPRSPQLQFANIIQPALVLGLGAAIGRTAAWNFVLLAGIVGSALLMFALVLRAGLHPAAAFFGGYVFGLSPYAFQKAYDGQIALAWTGVFPATLLALEFFRRRQSRTSAVVVGAVVGTSFYVHSYYGFFTVILALVYAVAASASGVPRRAILTGTLTAAVTALLVLLPAIVAVLAGSGPAVGLGRSLSDLQRLGARLPAYLLPSGGHPVFGPAVRSVWDGATSGEPVLFFGYTTLALAAYQLVSMRRRRPRQLLGIVGSAVAIFSLYASLPRVTHLGALPIPGLSYFVGFFFTSVRNYARFGVLFGFGLTLLACLGLDRIARTRAGQIAAWAAVPLVAFELIPYFGPTTISTGTPVPYAAWLRSQPRGNVAVYPSPGTSELKTEISRSAESDYFQQIFTRDPLFMLWGGHVLRTREFAIRYLTRDPAAPEAAGILAAEHVRYVVIHDDVYRRLGQPAPELRPQNFTRVARRAGTTIYRLRARPVDPGPLIRQRSTQIAAAQGVQPPNVQYNDGFFQPEVHADGNVWHWMETNGTLSVSSPENEHAFLEFSAFSAHRTRRLTLYGPDGRVIGRATISTSQVNLKLGPFSIPEGRSSVVLRASPSAEELGGGDTRVATIYVSPLIFEPLADVTGSTRSG